MLAQAFFAELEHFRLSACAALLDQTRPAAERNVGLAQWLAYFEAILADVRDEDPAAAERGYLQLLSQPVLDPFLQGQVYLSLGLAHVQQARWHEATTSYERALAIFVALDEPLEQVKSLKNLASAQYEGFARGDLGQNALRRAVAECRRALALLEQAQIDRTDTQEIDHFSASVSNTLGLAQRGLNRLDEAIHCFLRCLTICRRLGNESWEGAVLVNLGQAYQAQGAEGLDPALAAFHRALAIFRHHHSSRLECEALAGIGLLHVARGEPETALAAFERSLQRVETTRANISSHAARAGFAMTVADIYANTVLAALDAGFPALALTYVEKARSRSFLDQLAEGNEVDQLGLGQPLTTEAIQANLPDDALLLAYFTTGQIDVWADEVNRTAHRAYVPPARTILFAVTRDDVRAVDLNVSPNHLLPADPSATVERHFLQPAMRRTLYRLLLHPVADLLAGQARIYIAPHGPLHQVPFQALVETDEMGPAFVYTPSASVLLRHRQAPTVRQSTSGQSTGGRSTGGARHACLAIGCNGQGPGRLRHAEAEARMVARLTGGHLLTGAEADWASLCAVITDYRLLHFSCHGVFETTAPLDSYLALAGTRLTAGQIMTHIRLQCDLVTLSACETGLSKVRRGDELFGFVRALMYAGAPVLLATQWRVDERATHLLMGHFYRALQSGLPVVDALRRAQQTLRTMSAAAVITALAQEAEEGAFEALGHDLAACGIAPTDACPFADPYYWAGFIVIGDASCS